MTAQTRNYLVVTASDWGFTFTDGALRRSGLLQFYRLGSTPFTLAFMFQMFKVPSRRHRRRLSCNARRHCAHARGRPALAAQRRMHARPFLPRPCADDGLGAVWRGLCRQLVAALRSEPRLGGLPEADRGCQLLPWREYCGPLARGFSDMEGWLIGCAANASCLLRHDARLADWGSRTSCSNRRLNPPLPPNGPGEIRQNE